MEALIFVPAAVLAVGGALGVVLSRRPVHSALSLLLVLASLAVLYLLLWAQFIAVLQVVIYAGAIVVLFLFVIMLLHMQTGEPLRDPLRKQRPVMVVVAAFFLSGLTYIVTAGGVALQRGAVAPDFGTAEGVGRALFTRFLFPFELASVILLVGIVAAVAIAKEVPGLMVHEESTVEEADVLAAAADH